MIKIHIETGSGKEEWLEYPTGVDYNFDAHNNWVGVFNADGGLLASVATRHIVRIDSTENPITHTHTE